MIRNLAYHVYPLASGRSAWQWNLQQLRQRFDLFNGRRVIAVATGQETDSLADVRGYLGEDAEWLEVANDQQLGEVVSWLPLWQRLRQQAGVTFRGHAKGVTPCEKKQTVSITCHKSNHFGKTSEHHETNVSWEPAPTPTNRMACGRLWSSILYEANLDYWPLVERAFDAGAAMVGSLRHRYAPPAGYPAWLRQLWPAWQYLGTFYWVDNRQFFSKDWQSIPRSFYGTEMWPGFNFTAKETACLFHDTGRKIVPMHLGGFTGIIHRKFQRWKRYQEQQLEVVHGH